MNLTAVATAATVAFVLGRLVSRQEAVAARREASTDHLTGLVNRAGLVRELHNRTGMRNRYTVLLFDLNGFKPVNDTYGHRTGDELLVALGVRIQREFAEQVVARLGGDEFVVVLEGPCSAEVILAFMRHLQRTVEAPISLTGVPEPVKVSAAVGAAVARPREDPGLVLHAADQAMYLSKVTGEPQLQNVRTMSIMDKSPKTRTRDARGVRVA